MSASRISHWRFSLAALLLSVSGVAVACAVLPYPRAAFYSLLTFFFLTAIIARFGPPNAQRFWFWFALFGWGYIVLSMSILEVVESSSRWHHLSEWLVKHHLGPPHWTPEHYFLFAHFTLGACVAFVGGSSLSIITARHNSQTLDHETA